MMILNKNNFIPNFKSHYYIVNPNYNMLEIKADKRKKMGKNPYVEYKSNEGHTSVVEMTKQGAMFDARLFLPVNVNKLSYKIKYRDTGKIDDNKGKNYNVDIEKLKSDAMIYSRTAHRQPLVHAIKKGTATGKIVYAERINDEDLRNAKEPTIFVCEIFDGNVFTNIKNTAGLIFTKMDRSLLSHEGTNLRNNTDACASVYIPELNKKLKGLNGQNVKLTVGNGLIDVSEIPSTDIQERKINTKIEIPPSVYSSEIFTTDNYSIKNVGTKAYNLARLENLSASNRIESLIPHSITLPSGFIERMFDENEKRKRDYESCKNCIPSLEQYPLSEYIPAQSEKTMSRVLSAMEAENINTEKVMVRSSFNGEDISNYHAAGLYDSLVSHVSEKDLYENICRVALSKWNTKAVNSRDFYGIKHSDIKPSVIIQNKIDPDYKFTLYTRDIDGKLRIEMYSDKMWEKDGLADPYIFTYDRKKHKLEYESVQHSIDKVEFDEKFNIINPKPVVDKVKENYDEILPLVKKLVKDALVIEKEFGAPQDIEGGIKDDTLYLWQSRNIV